MIKWPRNREYQTQALGITTAQAAEANTNSSKDIEDTKQVALVEIQKLQAQIVAMSTICGAVKTRLGEQSDRDAALVMNMTSSLATPEQRANIAENTFVQCEANSHCVLAGLQAQMAQAVTEHERMKTLAEQTHQASVHNHEASLQ